MRQADDGSLAFKTATQLVEMMKARRISATELLDLYLDRIRKLDSTINAIITLDEDPARQEARKADEEIASGKSRGPLHGLPMTIKDAFETAGLRTTCGLEALRDHVPRRDAPAIGRLRQAGAIVFGKSNVPAGAGDHQTHNALFGRTRNPRNLDLTPGGSSGRRSRGYGRNERCRDRQRHWRIDPRPGAFLWHLWT